MGVLQTLAVLLPNFSSALSAQLVELSILCLYRYGDRVVWDGIIVSLYKGNAQRRNAAITDHLQFFSLVPIEVYLRAKFQVSSLSRFRNTEAVPKFKK